jgi:hypothetical protein
MALVLILTEYIFKVCGAFYDSEGLDLIGSNTNSVTNRSV